MPTIRINPNRKPKIVEIDTTDLKEAVESFQSAMTEVDEVLVERTEEVEAIKMCLLTRTHLMLEGMHGIAKSMLARSAFERIHGMRIFNKQFMKTTQTDEIFGPMIAEEYKKGIWRHNTEGYLPTAHGFFADEVYRASDHVLPSLMGVLNERTFFNGANEERCPLMTAIGTTNFTIESDELEAFHDRWHVHVDCQPLKAGSSVRSMLASFLDREDPSKIETITTVDLETLEFLQRQVLVTKVNSDCIEVADRLMAGYSKNQGDRYISDRRKCLAIRYAQAQAVLNGRSEVDFEDLEAMRYGLVKIRNTQMEQAWSTVHSSILGTFKKTRKERKNLATLEKYVGKLKRMYDPAMPKSEATALWKEVKTTLGALSTADADDLPETQEGKQRHQRLVQELESLLSSLSDKAAF